MNRIVSALFVLSFMNFGLCAHHINCKSAENDAENSSPNKDLCFAIGFAYPDPNQLTYDFIIDYAKPDKITEVEVSTNPSEAIEYIPKQIFVAFPNLRSFYMSTNLTELHSDDFINAMNLYFLGLAGNKIKVIRANVFSPVMRTAQLEQQNTTENSASDTTDSVYPLHKMFKLHLQKNEIAEIEDNSFAGLGNLHRIHLAENKLKVIRRLTFAGLPTLLELHLENNEIDTIEDDAFDFPLMDMLFLSGNRLKRLSDDLFKHLPKLSWFTLDNNQLERFGQTLSGVSKESFIIGLSNNTLPDIDLTEFAKMPKLQWLMVAKTGLSLSTIKFDDQQVWNSPLFMLDISSNNLTNADELKKLRIFPSIQVLALSGNLFSDLQIEGYETLKDVLPSLQSLHMIGLVNIECVKLTSIAQKLKSKGVEVVHGCN